MDIAVAASSALRLEQRTGWMIETGKRENWCNDMGPPKSAEIKVSATSGDLTPLQNISGIGNGLLDWNLSILELEQNQSDPTFADRGRPKRTVPYVPNAVNIF